MAFKLIESAQARWRAINAPNLVALVRAGARFENGKLVERPDDQEVISKPRDTPLHSSSPVGMASSHWAATPVCS
jgi:hypothetical protein